MSMEQADKLYNTKEQSDLLKPFDKMSPFEIIKECTFEDGTEESSKNSLNIKIDDF